MTNSTLAAVLHDLCRLAGPRDDRRQDDRQLLERFLERREEDAFALLIRRHGRMVLSACRCVLSNEADVEDAFQATFLVLLRRASSMAWRTSIGAWLFGVAHRVAVRARANAQRRQHRESEACRLRPELQPPPDLSWREAAGILHEELDRLPDSYRLPLLLCYFDGKTREEAATILACSAGAVKGRLERGREMLRTRLLRRGLTLSGALLTAASLATPPASALPVGLMTKTMKTILATTATDKGLAGVVSASVAALVENSSPILGFSKAKLAMLLLAVTLLGGGGVVVHFQRHGAEKSGTSPTIKKARPAAPAQPAAKEKQKDAVAFSGRVLDADGKPVPGVKVYYHFIVRQEEQLPVRTTTDAQGRFAFTLTPKDIPLSADADQADPRKTGHVIVKADGFTFAWHGVAKHQTDLTLRVTADDTPLTGRIIDLQGKPLAGLNITSLSVAAPEKGDLTPFVKALQERQAFYPSLFTHVPNYLVNPLIGKHRIRLLPTATTDANGRFRLRGFAKEQVVALRIEGATIQTQEVFVMTGPAPRSSRSLLTAPRWKDRRVGDEVPWPMVVLTNGFDHPVPPGQVVAGTVRDVDTKRPIPRAIVESYTLAGSNLGQNALFQTVADKQGRYRLSGLPRGKGNRIRIRPPADQPYIPVVKDVPAEKLFAEAMVDAALRRGVWVDVTAADKTTGRPVPGSVSYFVLPEKPTPRGVFPERPFAMSYDDFMPIGNDGTFRFVAVPRRRAFVAMRADWSKYPIASEAATIHFPFGVSAPNFQAFAEINPKPGDGPVKVKFVLDSGCLVKGKIVDPEGRPLSGVLAAGLRHDWYWGPDGALKTADFTVLGLHPDRPRLLCFVHPEKKLAGSVVVLGNEKAPITVKLQPWATVSGRLLDADGKPIVNATLWFTEVPVCKPTQPRSLDTGLHIVEHIGGQPSPDPRTDEQGRFHVERLVPGLKYNLALVDERGATRFEQIKWQGLVFRKLILKAGEAKELSDVKLQPFPGRDDLGAGKATAP